MVDVKDELREKEVKTNHFEKLFRHFDLKRNMHHQGPDLTETMKDQIRNWFAKEKEEQGKFPEYPSDEEGGSNLIFNPDAVVHDSDGETARRDEKGKKDEKKEGEEEEEKGFRLGPSDFLTSLKEGDKTFSGVESESDGGNQI